MSAERRSWGSPQGNWLASWQNAQTAKVRMEAARDRLRDLAIDQSPERERAVIVYSTAQAEYLHWCNYASYWEREAARAEAAAAAAAAAPTPAAKPVDLVVVDDPNESVPF